MRSINYSRGFTLLELLIVVLLIGFMSTLAVVGLSGGARPYEIKNEARDLYQQINLALEQAVLENTSYGLLFSVEIEDSEFSDSADKVYRYQWLKYDVASQLWKPPAQQDELLRDGELKNQIALSLDIDNRPFVIEAKREKDTEVAIPVVLTADEMINGVSQAVAKARLVQPDIYFLSSGEMLDFVIRVYDAQETTQSQNSAYRIKGETIGKMRFYSPGEEME